MSLSRAQMVISDDDDFTLTERRFFSLFIYLFIFSKGWGQLAELKR